MAAARETLYRDAPVPALKRIDVADVPDCGAVAVARLRAEAARRHRVRGYYAWPLWLVSCALILGIATFRQQPLILIGSFVALRDVCLCYWLNSDKARIIGLAIEEIVKVHGAERMECEARLRAEIDAWNAEADDLSAQLDASEWLTRHQCRLLHEAHRLGERKRSLIEDIGALRGETLAAA